LGSQKDSKSISFVRRVPKGMFRRGKVGREGMKGYFLEGGGIGDAESREGEERAVRHLNGLPTQDKWGKK